jgi:hypothetical protein
MTPQRRYLDAFPALTGRPREEMDLIVSAIREWFGPIELDKVPKHAWELLLPALQHRSSLKDVVERLRQ